MKWEFDSGSPIYKQIAGKIKYLIVSGKLKPGEKLLSVREWSEEAQVNPNTMQRALSELESQGLIYTERTSGRYVTEDISLIKSIKVEVIESKFKKFISELKYFELNNEEIIGLLKIYIKEMEINE